MLDAVAFNESGLVPVIAQDVDSDRVLMVAWMNREALVETVETGRAVYFSRSRRKLWRKGEESGHVQHVRSLRLDCDGDVVLIRVEQVGGIACHTGREHCFFRELDMTSGEWHSVEPVIRSPEAIYGDGRARSDRGEPDRGESGRGGGDHDRAGDEGSDSDRIDRAAPDDEERPS